MGYLVNIFLKCCLANKTILISTSTTNIGSQLILDSRHDGIDPTLNGLPIDLNLHVLLELREDLATHLLISLQNIHAFSLGRLSRILVVDTHLPNRHHAQCHLVLLLEVASEFGQGHRSLHVDFVPNGEFWC